MEYGDSWPSFDDGKKFFDAANNNIVDHIIMLWYEIAIAAGGISMVMFGQKGGASIASQGRTTLESGGTLWFNLGYPL